jgi:TolB-like protein
MEKRVISQKTTGAILLVGVLMLVMATSVNASDSKARMAEAMKHYASARYDKAISVLDLLAKDTTLDKKDRREVWLGLGRAYVAKNLLAKAKWAIKNLLDSEPPIVEPDPDAECPPLMKVYYEARKEQKGNTVVERPDPGMKTIAILDFKNRSVDDKERFDPMEKGFAELMISQLNGSVSLKVVERERIQWLMDEIGMENDPTKFDQSSAVRVGKLLGVHSVLLGSFIKVKDDMKLLARLVKVETAEILATDEVTGDADEFFDLAEQLSLKVARGINAQVTQAEVQKGTETKSLDAMMTYSEGLVLLEKGNYKGAYEKFMQAVNLDPAYEKAKTKAESLKPLLG